MSYADPNRRTYTFSNVDFGAGNTVHGIRGPADKTGRLIDVHVSATETFNSVTTDGAVNIGDSTDADKFAHFVPGDLAAESAVSGMDGVTDPDWIIDADIPANTLVEVQCLAPTGGTPAGIATVSVVIDWAW